jgi:hypothetical protein
MTVFEFLDQLFKGNVLFCIELVLLLVLGFVRRIFLSDLSQDMGKSGIFQMTKGFIGVNQDIVLGLSMSDIN